MPSADAFCKTLLSLNYFHQMFPQPDWEVVCVSVGRGRDTVLVLSEVTRVSPSRFSAILKIPPAFNVSDVLSCVSFLYLSNTCLLTMKIKLANFLFRVSWEFTGFMSLHGGFYLQTHRRACPGVEHSLSFSRDDSEHNLSPEPKSA